jgi:hypothetical protein
VRGVQPAKKEGGGNGAFVEKLLAWRHSAFLPGLGVFRTEAHPNVLVWASVQYAHAIPNSFIMKNNLLYLLCSLHFYRANLEFRNFGNRVHRAGGEFVGGRLMEMEGHKNDATGRDIRYGGFYFYAAPS